MANITDFPEPNPPYSADDWDAFGFARGVRLLLLFGVGVAR
jgi:hypothetical protein